MTWSYSGDPASSARDAVRFYVGDTDADDQLLSDEEVDFLLTETGSVPLRAAAAAARGLAAKYARQTNYSVGRTREERQERYRHFIGLAETLEERAAQDPSNTSEPVVTGTSLSEMDSVLEDEDRYDGAFRRGQFDYHDGFDDDTLEDWR